MPYKLLIDTKTIQTSLTQGKKSLNVVCLLKDYVDGCFTYLFIVLAFFFITNRRQMDCRGNRLEPMKTL